MGVLPSWCPHRAMTHGMRLVDPSSFPPCNLARFQAEGMWVSQDWATAKVITTALRTALCGANLGRAVTNREAAQQERVAAALVIASCNMMTPIMIWWQNKARMLSSSSEQGSELMAGRYRSLFPFCLLQIPSPVSAVGYQQMLTATKCAAYATPNTFCLLLLVVLGVRLLLRAAHAPHPYPHTLPPVHQHSPVPADVRAAVPPMPDTAAGCGILCIVHQCEGVSSCV
jgi:hypothetical protein